MIKKVWLVLCCLNAFSGFGQAADTFCTGKLTNYPVYLYGLPDTDTISLETALKIRKLASRTNDYPITRFCFTMVSKRTSVFRDACFEGDSLTHSQDSLKLYIARGDHLFFDCIIGRDKNGEKIAFKPRKYHVR